MESAHTSETASRPITPAGATASVPPERAARRPRWRRHLFVAAALIFVFGLIFHRQWLPVLVYPLLAPSVSPPHAVDVVWIRSSDGHSLPTEDAIPQAAAILLQNPDAVVIFTEGWPSRLVELGVIPPMVEVLRSALKDYGIPPERVIELKPTQIGLWYEAQAVADYLERHPNSHAVFFVEEFGGRSASLVLRSAMGDAIYRRITLVGVPHPLFSEQNWWRCRAGIKGAMVGYLYLFYSVIEPRPVVAPQPLSLDDFDRLIPECPESQRKSVP